MSRRKNPFKKTSSLTYSGGSHQEGNSGERINLRTFNACNVRKIKRIIGGKLTGAIEPQLMGSRGGQSRGAIRGQSMVATGGQPAGLSSEFE